MNTSDNAAPVQPNRSGVASRVQTGTFIGVWSVGALAVITSVLLFIGALSMDRAAGANWQPAGLLGLIAMCFGGTLLAVGTLARSIVKKSERP
ncbi:hypothetical protein [Streptomyces sp. NRRL F-5755]|uniref:hypothetical protein n=1 Tax=Streptomyces sp. NRRL F-5755 TaxID=1519475 RepID=UPI0013315B98|nr:hypothetical protein [Streptomyces sp. NRRL F-5755]